MLPLLLSYLQAPETITLNVDGVSRSAIVYRPSVDTGRPNRSPVVFVFHGHFGSDLQAANKYDLQDAWPNATIVYPQGLITDSPLVGKGTGWQHAFGENGDRDLKFLDALAKYVSTNFVVDEKRFYACGMSNGAQFSLMLLSARPNLFAAYASVSGAGGAFLLRDKTPKPVLMINGTQDPLVAFNAAERTRNFYLRVNGCADKPSESSGYELYKSPVGADVGWRQFSGGHSWPSFATDNIVRFFKSH